MQVKIKSKMGAAYDASASFLSLSEVSGLLDSSDLNDLDEIRAACGLEDDVIVEPNQFVVTWLNPNDWNEHFLLAERIDPSGNLSKPLEVEELLELADQNDEVDSFRGNDDEIYLHYRQGISDDHSDAMEAVKNGMTCFKGITEVADWAMEAMRPEDLIPYVDMEKLGNDILQDHTYVEINGRYYVFF